MGLDNLVKTSYILDRSNLERKLARFYLFMRVFQKFSQLISPLVYLFMTPLAFAATGTPVPANPCPSGQGNFDALCNVTGSHFGQFVGNAVVALMVLASLVALGFLIYGGVKWIMSEGDKTAVENARNTIVGAVIGLVVVFTSYLILSIILGIFGISLSDLAIPRITPLQ